MDNYDTERNRNQRHEVHLHVHLDGPITVNVQLLPPLRPKATRGVVVLKGSSMAGQITVDTQNEQASVLWTDDKGDTDAQAPAGAVVTYASDNLAAATVDPTTGKVTPVGEGSGNITATASNADGTPLLEADGVTAFAFAPAPFTVSAGAATGGSLTLSV